jgi:two-component system, sensor histidine kinase PdtaS
MRIFSLKNYSFTTKVILSFFIFISLFMLIRFILIVPKIEAGSFNKEINTITNSLQMIKEQLNITSEAIIMQSNFEKSLRKKTIENELKKLDLETKNLSRKHLIEKIKKNPIINSCSYQIIYSDVHHEKFKHSGRFKQNDLFSKNNTDILKQWYKYQTNNKSWNFRTQNYFFYNYPFQNNDLLLCIACGRFDLNPNHVNFGESLKQHVRTNLLIDPSLKSTKVALF